MKKRLLVVGIGLIGLFIVSMCLGGAIAQETVAPTAIVAATVELNLTEAVIDWDAASLDCGTIYDDTSMDIEVKANTNWIVTVSTDQLLTGVTPPNETIPSANFYFSCATGGNVTFGATNQTFPITPAPAATACSGTRGIGSSNTTYTLDVPWTVQPDTYTGATHTYTIAAN